MKLMSKAILLCAGLVLAACTNPNRFDNAGVDGQGGAGAGANGALAGSAQDPTSPAFFQQTVGDRVLFAVDQSSLTPEGQATLDGQAEWLFSNPEYKAVIEGHADEQGTRDYNLALGARRANTVQEYLSSKGLAPNRMKVVSFGKERPLELCSEEACYSKNRRAVTVISVVPLS